ncbi:hypothetical protein ABT124_37480 [Streptomyces sp. NPDC001982]|uniref:hypothetical protein n=1 Tax=unclassified Streptomyces TaxID=2593676 RepID=UPI00332A17EA
MVLVFKDPAGEPMSVPKQVFLWAWPLLPGAIAWVRFGTTWGLLEGIAVYSWWLTMVFGRAGAVSWLRRHLITTFVLFVFLFATLFFALPTLLLGTVLSVWWCWALGLFAGVIVTALIWPAQRRFWARLDG